MFDLRNTPSRLDRNLLVSGCNIIIRWTLRPFLGLRIFSDHVCVVVTDSPLVGVDSPSVKSVASGALCSLVVKDRMFRRV